VSEYLEEMCIQLSHFAEEADAPLLAYFLDLARYEATLRRRQGGRIAYPARRTVFIEEICGELAEIAEGADLGVLGFFLKLARYEAAQTEAVQSLVSIDLEAAPLGAPNSCCVRQH